MKRKEIVIEIVININKSIMEGWERENMVKNKWEGLIDSIIEGENEKEINVNILINVIINLGISGDIDKGWRIEKGERKKECGKENKIE